MNTGTPAETPEQARDRVRHANETALIAVMQETGVQLPIRTFMQWRPTVRVRATITGVTVATILATDGVLGLFIQKDSTGHVVQTFFGHIKHFDGIVQTLYGVPKPFAANPDYKHKPSARSKELKNKREERIAMRVAQILADIDEQTA